MYQVVPTYQVVIELCRVSVSAKVSISAKYRVVLMVLHAKEPSSDKVLLSSTYHVAQRYK